MRAKRARIIAPRLLSGDKRESIGHGLPPEIKQGLRAIARSENKSVSWVLEQIIIEYFGFNEPQYIIRKNKETNQNDQTHTRPRIISHGNRRTGTR